MAVNLELGHQMAECATCFDYLLKKQMHQIHDSPPVFCCASCTRSNAEDHVAAVVHDNRRFFDMTKDGGVYEQRCSSPRERRQLVGTRRSYDAAIKGALSSEPILRSPSSSKRSSMELYRKDSARNRSQSNTSFDELMSRIRLSENVRTEKSDALDTSLERHSTGRLSRSFGRTPTAIAASDGSRYESPDRVLTPSELVLDRETGMALSHQQYTSDEDAATHSGTSISYVTSEGTNCDSHQSDVETMTRIPSSRSRPKVLTNGHMRRQSTPLGWRIPSTKYEAEENDASEKDAMETSQPNQHVRPSSPQPVRHQSRSNGHLPGLFAQHAGRPVTKKFGGSRRCSGCSGSVFPMEETAGPKGTVFHRACLRCQGCAKKLDSSARFTQVSSSEETVCLLVHCRTCWDKRADG